MPAQKTVDQLDVGDELEPCELYVSPELNRRYCEALEDLNGRYFAGDGSDGSWVHPGLLLNQSNVTRSVSHVLPNGIANIHAKEEVEFFKPALVGRRLRFFWRVLEKYMKRNRSYMVFECGVSDEDGIDVLRRRMTSTFSRGGE